MVIRKRKVRVYLGGSRGKWRSYFAKMFPECECYNPFTHSKQTALMDFAKEDLEAIKNSDVIFLYINYRVYTGACVEAGYAYALGKPVVLVFCLKGYIDPLLLGVSRKVFTDIESAMEWFHKSENIKQVRT